MTKTKVFFSIAIVILVITSSAFFLNKEPSENKNSIQRDDVSEQYFAVEKSLIISFPINGTSDFIDGEVIIDGMLHGQTQNGTFTLRNFSTFPSNISLKIKAHEIKYTIPKTFRDFQEIRLIVSQEEYEKYKRYFMLSTQDSFSQSPRKHWNHMPLTYAVNFSEYDTRIKASKELKVKYALERLHNAVPSISFQRVETEELADVIFKGEIPPKIRENTRPDGNFNTAGLAFHSILGNIIVKGTVYLPLPTEGEECPSSDIALHEVLHTFSLQHSNNVKSVLWDTASCTNNEIISEDISFLKGIYG